MMSVEAGRDKDGHFPAESYIASLKASGKLDEEDRYYDLWARIEVLVTIGQLEQPREFRELDKASGLYEIKTSEDRVGCYRRPAVLGAHSKSLRLTHGWDKATNKTVEGKLPSRLINYGNRLISEDMSYGD